jgi:hypothetical protein
MHKKKQKYSLFYASLNNWIGKIKSCDEVQATDILLSMSMFFSLKDKRWYFGVLGF